MARSVGRLEFTRLQRRQRSWVIGAAPRLPDHWMLRHEEREAARLVLLFESDASARSEIGEWLRNTSRPINVDDAQITDYMERRLRDLHVDGGLSVAEAVGQPMLHAWLHAVVESRTNELPEEFAHTRFDVVLLPKREECPGRLALIRESRIGEGITIANARALTF